MINSETFFAPAADPDGPLANPKRHSAPLGFGRSSVRRLLEHGLLRRLNNPSPEARRMAAARLGSLQDIGPEALSALASRSLLDPSESVRYSAEVSLEELQRSRSLHERLAHWQRDSVEFDAVETFVAALIAPSDDEAWPYWSAWLEPVPGLRRGRWVGREGLTAAAQDHSASVTIQHLPTRLESAPLSVATLPGTPIGAGRFVVATAQVARRTATVPVVPSLASPLLLVTGPHRPALAA